MAKEFLTPPDFKAGLLLNGSAGTTGQQITSQGPGQPPVWGAPGSGSSFAGYAVGNWIAPVIGTSAAGGSLTANTIALYPFTVNRAVTISDLGFRVTTGVAGTSIQGAIYASDASNNVTGAALGSTAGLSSATATSISGAVTPFTLNAGALYWFAVNSDGAPTLLALATTNTYFNAILGASNLADITSSATSSMQIRTVAQTYGTWPNLTGVTAAVATGTNAIKGAMPIFKISALP